jgi:hypothetical protein
MSAAGRCAAQGREGGGFAAADLQERAAALQAGGRAARGYGAAPPASRLLRIAPRCRAPLRDGPAGAGLERRSLCGPPGRKYGQAPACPAQRRGASGAPVTGAPMTPARPARACTCTRMPGEANELAFEQSEEVENYTNPL